MLSNDVKEGLNVSNVGKKFPKDIPSETNQNKGAVFNESSTSEKNSETKVSVTENDHLK